MSSTDQLVADGRPTTLYVADVAGDDAPGVVLYHAWWGLNDDVKTFADHLADAGFYVVAPDIYRGSITTEIEEAEQLTRSVDEADADAIALAAIDRLADAAECAEPDRCRRFLLRRPLDNVERSAARCRGRLGRVLRNDGWTVPRGGADPRAGPLRR